MASDERPTNTRHRGSQPHQAYKDLDALDGISLTLGGDRIYGLLGRNGAGKTTLMSILTGTGLSPPAAKR